MFYLINDPEEVLRNAPLQGEKPLIDERYVPSASKPVGERKSFIRLPNSVLRYSLSEIAHVDSRQIPTLDMHVKMQYEPRISVSGNDRENSGLIMVSKPKPKPKTKKPPLYKVLLLNDDYTPMEFVVEILMRVFKMPESKAYETMMAVHNKGLAVVGIYSHQIAETKVAQVMSYAKMHQHPLQCTMEKD